ncbi:hypothetical protein BBJ28_00006635 [Nothophytophthora sp. Chile5]|nr:hypothetical protein BBJ28_00006635 [Nothophytophthora sp. Chile5]
MSHVAALGVTSYYVIKVYLFKDILGEDNSPGVALFVFLYIFLMLMIGVTASERAPNDQEEEEREHVREDYLSGVQRRIESYESCVSAITAATASLQELSTNLDTMKLATQQLNAFTGGWLAVWKRPS